MQRPRDTLTERMQRQVERALADADAALFVLNGEHTVGPGDRFIARAIARAGVATVTAVNKVDRLDKARTVEALAAAGALELARRRVPDQRAQGHRGARARGAPRRARCRRAPSSTRRRTTPTCPRACAWPSWCASRCCAARARSFRTPWRSRCPSIERARRRPAHGARAGVGRERVPEGDPGRGRGQDDQGDRHRGARARSSAPAASACTWTSRCGSGAAGAATRACSTGSASSDRARAHPELPRPRARRPSATRCGRCAAARRC